MEKLGEFFITLASSSAVVAAVALFSKNVIAYFLSTTVEMKKAELNQELESFKQKIEQENSELQHRLDQRLQEHRGNLERINYEFSTRFNRMHQERADVIKEVYRNLVMMHGAMYDYTREMHIIVEDGEKEAQSRLDNVNKTLADFTNYYLLNKIFLSSTLCEKIDYIIKEYHDKGWDFAWSQRMFKEGTTTKEDYRAEVEKTRKISNTIQDEMPPLIEELEAEFRSILGVTG